MKRRQYGRVKKNLLAFWRASVAIFVGLYAVFFCFSIFTANATPDLASYYLAPMPTDNTTIDKLAKKDVLIFTATQMAVHRGVVEKIKAKNPDVIILAYVPSQSYNTRHYRSDQVFRNMQMQDDWWLKDVNGQTISFWPDIASTNMSQGWSEYLVNFINNNISNIYGVDGIFLDMVSENISWISPIVDLNRDGAPDDKKEVDKTWLERTEYFLHYASDNLRTQYIVINGSSKPPLQPYVNGRMFETFPTPWEGDGRWSTVMSNLVRNKKDNKKPNLIIFNSNTNNTGRNADYRKVRFGLGSSLLEDDVYFSFDYGDRDHGQTWWYDEYDVNLGEPLDEAKSITGASKYKEDVWVRDYSNGLVIVNSTNEAKKNIDLGAEYEKINGKQDPVVNNGFVTDRVDLAAKDGLLMLKTAQKLNNVVFDNGAFVRFVNMKGERVRNGFFASEDGYGADARLYSGDLDDEVGLEKIVAKGGHINIFNNKGGIWYNENPFGMDFTSDIEVAVGEMNNDSKINFLFAPSFGGKVSLYNYYGGALKENFYPLGKKFKGGFSVAIGKVVDKTGNAVLGVGRGKPAEVLVYDNNLGKIKKRFFPYEKNFAGGVNVACGDVNGDGVDEIITVPMSGKTPLVRVFDVKGKKLSEFLVSSTFSGSLVRVAASDVNFDGADEIVLMSR